MSDSLKQDQQQPHPSLGVVTIHDARPAFAKYMVHLPAENKLVEPGYHDLHGDKVPVRREPGIVVRVLSGRSGDIEAIPRMSKYVLVTILDVRLDGDGETSFIQEIPAGDEGFVYVLSGKGYFSSGVRQSADQVGHLAHTSATDRPTTLNVSANEPIGFLLWQEDHYGNQ